MKLPTALRPGDRVAVVSPSSPADAREVVAGMRVLRSLGLEPTLFGSGTKTGSLTPAPLVSRIRQIKSAVADKSFAMILASTGGLGASELLSLLPYEDIAASPKVWMGFSDTTALLNAIVARSGVTTFLGPSASVRVDFEEHTMLDAECLADAVERLSIVDSWGNPFEGASESVAAIVEGEASGLSVGGNLTVFAGLLGTRFCPELDGAVLFLEDINLGAFEVRRLLGDLAIAGVFERVAAVCLGDFSLEPTPVAGDPSIAAVLVETFRGASFPVVGGLDFSHESHQACIPLGVTCSVSGTSVTFAEAVS